MVPESSEQGARVSRYGAETIGCHEKNERRGIQFILHSTRRCTGKEEEKRQAKVLADSWLGGGPACMPVRAVVPDEGGRGIERLDRLRQFWRANPAAGRVQGTSCYINLWPSARHYHACRRRLPFHALLGVINTAHTTRSASHARVSVLESCERCLFASSPPGCAMRPVTR
ncbi:hypothetical protein BU26DRAFT_47011 [Trematosphaeria pertusa]|uniref:Uncharacterized protein n=1 Tax=Trematosphaeria pertusa TaxID=390896 RepID=A0A6A6I7Y3_9PLEO|nr:uncharacterized protein BU26DRAFT_47011 [Trematosphaeria pertusa]KAF2246481.1 hypothetical protein BU26DRAFT_47011 [Trematosphaeria pertusa]